MSVLLELGEVILFVPMPLALATSGNRLGVNADRGGGDERGVAATRGRPVNGDEAGSNWKAGSGDEAKIAGVDGSRA
jgi:hypothetical protein